MTTTELIRTGGPNCRCELCLAYLAEHEVIAHLVLHHGDEFGLHDLPVRANVEDEAGTPL